MKPQLQTPAPLSQSRAAAIRNLYDNYAATLLGYIFEVVQNQLIAEQYLIAVFNNVPNEIEELSKTGVNVFCRLQIMARQKMVDFFETPDNDTGKKAGQNMPWLNNKPIALMTPLQQQVFCGIYYQCKTTSHTAKELNKTEEEIRKILKECFTIIRNGRYDEKIH
ncbi:sigma factor-like helix-turn-helix DNA-binding protein [Mucilaginibacter sp. SJ]|uniref:sigma factor-like helix-turn-helix DNA-binding protein n=1 Tax=Mucilaginibacter sp. SJ TaxID=3029053 RepID=UPI0023A9BBB9|nr:sigma factor-like helix-turn-helix DNA-binding protein [Mucilaginibacter sp. SJ]WEA00201.1 sigma factor-like helix-turn-helix DNA-binding protein [Mucilaginibacter sp. SJ]